MRKMANDSGIKLRYRFDLMYILHIIGRIGAMVHAGRLWDI